MERLSSLLEDRWVAGTGDGVPLVDAVSGETIARASSDGLDRAAALRFAREVGGPALRGRTFAQRAELLKALSRSVHARRDELLELSRRNYGATRGDAKFDVDGASGTLAYYAALGRGLGDRKVLLDGDAEEIGQSKRFVGQHLLLPRRGVAVHVNAFNFPAWGMCEKLAVALLAGVPALVKPATATSLVTWSIVRGWHAEGLLPAGAVSLLVGDVGDLLDHLEVQDVVAFTGSSATARRIRGHARVLDLGIPVNVEADSLNASVLGPDAEPGEPTFEMFVGDVVRDLVQKAGQKCTAVRRVFVPRGLLEPVREALSDHLSRVRVGDPAAKDVTVGPVSTAAQLDDVEGGVARLAELFPTFVASAGAGEGPGFFVRPRLFLSEQLEDAPFVHDHEVFGPVATVLVHDGDAAAVSRAVARGGGGLVASLYTDDAAWAGALIGELAPWHGRIHWGSRKVADQSPGPGTVLPGLVHGGPGKAGGGEELGGLRGLRFYQQRTAVQADRALLERALGTLEG